MAKTHHHMHPISPSSQGNLHPHYGYNVNGELPTSHSEPTIHGANASFDVNERKNLTPYEKLLYESTHDARFKAEEAAGRRIGFYRILKDIGLGNFSRVKLGVHLLAQGREFHYIYAFFIQLVSDVYRVSFEKNVNMKKP